MPFRQSPLAAYKAAAGLARDWRHNEKTQFLPSCPIKRLQPDLFARRYRSILTRTRNSGQCECIAKDVSVRGCAPRITMPEARYSEPRFELQ